MGEIRRILEGVPVTLRTLDDFPGCPEVEEDAETFEGNAVKKALDIASAWAGDAQKLAVENLEGYPLDFWEPVFERSTASRCVPRR